MILQGVFMTSNYWSRWWRVAAPARDFVQIELSRWDSAQESSSAAIRANIIGREAGSLYRRESEWSPA
jgi:hypothetical protein